MDPLTTPDPGHPMTLHNEAPLELHALDRADAGELFTLQRAAFVTEAQRYGDPLIPALSQTFDDLRQEMGRVGGIALRRGGRLIGAVRTRALDGALRIERLIVAPDQQHQGLGRLLLGAAETGVTASTASTATVLVGHLSVDNQRFFGLNGYVETARHPMRPGIEVLTLSKPLR